MKRSAASFLILALITILYFGRSGLGVVLVALLFFAVVPSVSLLIWCWLAPMIAEQQYIRFMGWSAEQAEQYRTDLRDAASADAWKAKGERALKGNYVTASPKPTVPHRHHRSLTARRVDH